MISFIGHFDGAALIPDEPVDLPYGRPLVIRVEANGPELKGVPGSSLAQFIGTMSREDADEISQAIEEGCEKVDRDGW